jgi:hypothetical protein
MPEPLRDAGIGQCQQVGRDRHTSSARRDAPSLVRRNIRWFVRCQSDPQVTGTNCGVPIRIRLHAPEDLWHKLRTIIPVEREDSGDSSKWTAIGQSNRRSDKPP